MPILRATSRRSSSFPWWSLGLLLGFLLVILWKRFVDRRNRLQAGPTPAARPKITLENVEAEAETVAAPAAESGTEPEPRRKDDLRKLEGIGPKVQAVLNGAGVLTYAQLARASQKKLKGLLDSAGYGYMNPETWPEQAGLAAKGDWEGLARLKAGLKGGRRG